MQFRQIRGVLQRHSPIELFQPPPLFGLHEKVRATRGINSLLQCSVQLLSNA
jgi:hypothetical protein